MDATAINALATQVRKPQEIGQLVAVPTDWHLHDPLSLVKPEPAAAALAVYSLGALRDYLVENRDALPLDKLVVHVTSPQIVRVLGTIRSRARDREEFVQAKADNLLDTFIGKWMPQEEFIIGMQTRFDNAGDRQAVIALASTMTHEAVNTSADDGVGQTVTAKAGVALKATVPVPNPVTLRPFRTFREVQQPDSLFVLRVNQSMQLGLFEADGGAWRLEAIARVGAWLHQQLDGINVSILA